MLDRAARQPGRCAPVVSLLLVSSSSTDVGGGAVILAEPVGRQPDAEKQAQLCKSTSPDQEST